MLNHYLDARVSLMASRLLRKEELPLLAEGSDTNMARVLERAGIARIAADMAAGHYLEQSIVRNQLADILILLRAADDARSFLQHWTLRFELTNLKAIIRAKMSGAPLAAVRRDLIELGYLASLPTEDLLLTENIGELLRRLETTHYADIVRFARLAFERQPRLFDLDSALDRRFYHGLVEQARPLEAALGESFRGLMQLMIDRINLVWLLRFRFDYKLPSAQVYYLLIPSHYRLTSGVLLELLELHRLESMLAVLPQPYAAWLKDAHSAYEVFTIMDRKAAQAAQSVLRSGAPAFARAFAYLILRERDLRRVRAALKGRGMGLDPQIISQAMGLQELQPSFAVKAA